MADDNENTQFQVPTFTVLKNGSILKNIFLLRKQNSSPNQESILLVGRHPHCNITLEHPSISRHHLRIHSNPSSQTISVVDLASVHGTWVSGKRIDPGVNVGLKEGDTVKMGGSSRVYELHWVPLSQAYDGDGRFVSTIYPIKEGDEEMNKDEKLETQLSDDDLEPSDLSLPNNIHDSPLKTLSRGMSLDPEYFSSSCEDTELEQSNSSKTDNENGEIISTILVPSPLVVSGTISPIEDSDSLNESEDQLNLLGDNLSNDFELQNHGIVKKDLVSESNCSESSCGVTEVEDTSLPKTSNENCIGFSCVSVHAPTPPVVSRTTSATDISDGLKELEDPLNWLKDNLSNEFELQSHGIIREDLCSVPNCSIFACNGSEVEHWIPWNIGNKDGLSQDISSSLNKSEDWSNWLRDNLSNEFEQLSHGTLQDDLISVNHYDAIKMHEKDVLNQDMSRSDENEQLDEQEFDNGSLPVALFEAVIRDEDKSFMLDGPRDNEINVGCEFEQMTQTKMMDESASEVLFEGVDSKVEDDVLCKPIIPGEEEVDLGVKFESIDHEIMKEKSVFEVVSNETDMDQEQTFSPDISRAKEVHMNLEAMKNVLVLMNLLDSLDGNNLELFTPDKENKNPNDCSGRSLEKPWNEDRNYCTMSAEAVSPSVNDEKDIFSFSKTLSISEDEVNPLVYCEEVLLSSSEEESQSSQTKMEGSCSSIICPQTVEKVINSSHGGKLETQSSDDDLECSDLSLPDNIHDSPLKTLSIGTSLHPEYFSSSCEYTELEQSNLSKTGNKNGERFSTILVQSPRVVSGTIPAIEDSENGKSFSTISLNLFDSLDGNDLELFTPDKENKNPNDCSGRSIKKTWKEDRNYCTVSTEAVSPTVNDEKDISGFSKVLSTSVEEVNPFLKSEEVLSSSEKESQSSQTKMVGSCSSIIWPQTVEKVDEVNSFISCEEVLLSSSEKESQSKMEGSCSSIICPQTVENSIDSSHGGEKKRWTMIVDTNTLLHDESLKHLKLLKGLKGTRLLVPKIVIREVMDIKNQDNFLKRREKKVSLALKWIDECLENAKWWIHMEDESAISSEAESQVLETAICLRKKITDGKIVILSNDLSLKIKAMAEGIMCEAAEEFRRSLVNPFSERFMWVGSSAIGLTWSSVDDDAVKSQKYHGCVLNGSHELKGLKLLAYV